MSFNPKFEITPTNNHGFYEVKSSLNDDVRIEDLREMFKKIFDEMKEKEKNRIPCDCKFLSKDNNPDCDCYNNCFNKTYFKYANYENSDEKYIDNDNDFEDEIKLTNREGNTFSGYWWFHMKVDDEDIDDMYTIFRE